MESRPNNPTCPVCKSVIQKEKLIPLYGRGSSDKKDPRDNVPPRPPGQREEPQNANYVSLRTILMIEFYFISFIREQDWKA